MFYRKYSKPIFESVISILLLVLLSPLLVCISIVNFCLYRKVFFYQARTGKNMKNFCFVKFKTMKDQSDIEGLLVSDIERMNVFGKFLRFSSLDELPQLWLILKGDMSLIGPRPLLPEYNKFYNEEQKKRFIVKPGISGWAQVHGRNRQTWQERFILDVYYVQNVSLLLDMKIYMLTILQLVKYKDVNASINETMAPFNQ